ncbi:aminodeoxychorismate synthase component I [Noviherbaspirillum massiliense]|uniref:aminodeoxychorismate synthase component I n=1 Tax=Noviherbaspirillum massiliense TaxID=1465823 RepID=UPI000687FA15|nr:aminodeoxychorismate synthase component I [Noviherbaspirillum massiliense]
MTTPDSRIRLNPSPESTVDCFALLDDAHADSANPRSRLYTGYVGMLACDEASGLPTMLDQMQQALQHGRHAVGLFSYELGAAMQGIAPRIACGPLAQVLLFERMDTFSAAEVSSWLGTHVQSTQPAGIADVQASISEADFHAAIERIHAYIEAGDTYQVNCTYRLRFDAYGDVWALYQRLRLRQPVPYGALIALPDGGAVLSFSPELFVRHEGGTASACPMKGTAAASGDAQVDAQRAAELAADPKNRAENLMIVDLLRNDLGRIAMPGAVQVPQLFRVDRYSSVLQMTSTVQAGLRQGTSLAEVFSALYPCGSITGAPKHRTMQIIRELEPDARGIYTGALGWFDAPRSGESLGAFCLSVPIRTLALQPPGNGGVRKGEMGVGAGIVHDSNAVAEYAECQLKAGFLTGLPAEFELFETMHATRENGCRHLELHLQRLRASAAYFGFACDEAQIRERLQQHCAALSLTKPFRLRLSLKQDGTCTMQSAPLAPLAGPVRLLLAQEPTDAGDLFLRHKTTVRANYDAAWREAEAQGAFDQLFCNADGELTEGGRSNLFVKLRGRWYTPPLSAGVLPGVMRAVLLADPGWQAEERRLTLDDLRAAEQVLVCNALRGVLAATIVWG